MGMREGTRLVGEAPAFLDIMDQVSRAAPLNRPVLVIGERGTGKELIAERLHRLSLRWSGPFLELNCAALPETLIDSELFGYEAGAFTGAQKARTGRFEDADTGTLFLDEVATLSSQAQEKLLRVLEYGELQRLGSNKTLRVDVRVVAATNEDLPSLVDGGRFRADLLDRLSFDVITLPPLRARVEDIDLLADHFGRAMARELELPYAGFNRQARAALRNHDWPGNVRELKNVVERAVYRWPHRDRPIETLQFDPFDSPWRPKGRAQSMSIDPAIPPASAPNIDFPDDFRTLVARFEKQVLEQALAVTRYHQRQTATLLNLTYDQLRHALRKHDLL
jgi:psp operon transcriptional activator